jgi:Na+/melibiose symporter-like transporter
MAFAVRVFLVVCGVCALLQVRCFLPPFVREVVTTMAMGSICLVAVTRHYLSAYWYGAILLMAVGYLCAHWQYFRIKSRLRKAYPGKNPTSHAVNEALDAVETHRWWIAIMTPIFGLTQVALLLHHHATTMQA